MMRQNLGMALQFVVLVFLPLVIIFQLNFGIPLVVMPACTVAGIVVFWLGTKLRESG